MLNINPEWDVEEIDCRIENTEKEFAEYASDLQHLLELERKGIKGDEFCLKYCFCCLKEIIEDLMALEKRKKEFESGVVALGQLEVGDRFLFEGTICTLISKEKTKIFSKELAKYEYLAKIFDGKEEGFIPSQTKVKKIS